MNDIDNRALSVFARLDSTIATGASRGDVAAKLAELYCELFDADYCRFWWRTEDDSEVRVVAHYPPIEFKEDWEHIKRLDSAKSSVVKSIFIDGELMIEADPSGNPHIENRYVTVYGAKSGVHVPITVGGKVVGDLALVSKREKGHFTEEHRTVLLALSNISALALYRF